MTIGRSFFPILALTAPAMIGISEFVSIAQLQQDEVKLTLSAVQKTTKKKNKQKKKKSFKRFKSSFVNMAGYWPTRSMNPLSRPSVKEAVPAPITVSYLNVEKKYELTVMPIEIPITEYDQKKLMVKANVKDVKSALMQDRSYETTLTKVRPVELVAATSIDLTALSAKLASFDSKLEDKVKTKVAAVNKKNQNDDLVFYDVVNHTEVEVEVDDSKTEVATRPTRATTPSIISPIVKQAIAREMQPTSGAPLVASNNSVQRIDYHKMINAVPVVRKKAEQDHLTVRREKRKNSVANGVTLTPRLVDLERSKVRGLYNFKIESSFNQNDVKNDFGEGFVKFNSAKNSVYTGTIFATEIYTTTFSVGLSSQNDYSVPVFTVDQFDHLLTTQKKNLAGGHILVALTEDVDSVDIETGSDDAIYLNEDFNVVKEDEAYSYVLFPGIEQGSQLLTVLTKNGEITQRIIGVTFDQITFVETFYDKARSSIIGFYQHNVLGRNSVMHLSKGDVKYFNLEIFPEKLSVNEFKYTSPPLLEGMRQYLSVKYDGQQVFLGHKGSDKVELPSSEAIDYYFDKINMSQLGASCFVGISFERPITEFNLNGISSHGQMVTDIYYQTVDGEISSEIDGPVKKVFVLGDHQGVMFYDAIDGRNQHITNHTYCSPGSMIFEQL